MLYLATIGTQEVLLIAVVVLVLFGARKIPELARSVGRAAGELQKGIKESQRMVVQAAEEVKHTGEETETTSQD
jgi:sec-independent protein translocase protein TatA